MKLRFIDKKSVTEIKDRLKEVVVSECVSVSRCLEILSDQIYRLYKGGKTVDQILEIINNPHVIATKEELIEAIEKRAARLSKPRKRRSRQAVKEPLTTDKPPKKEPEKAPEADVNPALGPPPGKDKITIPSGSGHFEMKQIDVSTL